MPRKKTDVEYFEVKYSCDGDHTKLKFKAGQLHKEEHPGVVMVVYCQNVREMLEETGIIEPQQVRTFPNLQSLLAQCSDIILEWEELQAAEGASGDCFCFMDHRGVWRCLCEN